MDEFYITQCRLSNYLKLPLCIITHWLQTKLIPWRFNNFCVRLVCHQCVAPAFDSLLTIENNGKESSDHNSGDSTNKRTQKSLQKQQSLNNNQLSASVEEYDSGEEREDKIKKQNKLRAQKSRNRKKQYVEDLEQKVNILEK